MKHIQTAIKLFEKAQRSDLACQVIEQNAASIEDRDDRAALYVRLAELHEKWGVSQTLAKGRVAACGDRWIPSLVGLEPTQLFAGQKSGIAPPLRRSSEPSSRPTRGARGAACQGGGPVRQSGRRGESPLLACEEASKLQPDNDAYAAEVEKRYVESSRFVELAEFFGARAAQVTDKKKRAPLFKRAAEIQSTRLEDRDAARTSLELALAEGEDADVLARLADDAEERGDFGKAKILLHRAVEIVGVGEKAAFALREARLLADSLGDPEEAVRRYLWVLDVVDPKIATR